jgi:hypothetical protein
MPSREQIVFKRLLTSLTLAGLVAVGVPSPSHAVVADRPEAGFPSFDNIVLSFARSGATLYVGGQFGTVTDTAGAHTRHGAAAINLNTGLVLPWNPNVHGTVRDVAVGREGVYLAGSFDRVKKQARKNVARVAVGGKGKVNLRFHPRTNGPVNTITLDKARVYFGGDFTSVGRTDRTRLAAVRRVRPFKVTPWAPKASNGRVTDLVRKRAGIYVAGEFRSLNGDAAFQRLALVNKKRGATVRAFNPGASRTLLDIAVGRGAVYAAEGGLRGGGALAFARSDGQTLWQRRFDGDAQAIIGMGDQIYVGGHFNGICDDAAQEPDGTCTNGRTPRLRGASLAPDTGNLTGWDPRADSDLGITTFAAVPRQQRLVVGGAFTHMNGGTTNVGRFAVFNTPASP